MIEVTVEFKYSLDGMHVTTFETGKQEVPEEVAAWAIEQKFAKPAK